MPISTAHVVRLKSYAHMQLPELQVLELDTVTFNLLTSVHTWQKNVGQLSESLMEVNGPLYPIVRNNVASVLKG